MWPFILRASAILSVALTLKQIYDQYTNEVTANRIYSTQQASRFLGIDRKSVINLIKKEEIKANMVNGNYRVIGSSILEYLSKK